MEDRYTAGDNLRGQHKLVRKFYFFERSFGAGVCGLGSRSSGYGYEVFSGTGVVESLKLFI